MFTTAPVPASRKALEKAGLSINDMDVIEVNEAFAGQVIYYLREMKLKVDRINVNGGAVALGHPIAATGNIILTKLLYELARKNGKYGLATMCIGGGQGISIIVDREI
jgi:acetyl-CoA C-acetyltransferase